MDAKHCYGCEDDFYNDKNPYGIKKCWLLSGAKLITRYQIGMWDSMGKKSNFHKVKKPQCYHAKGSVFVPNIPRGLYRMKTYLGDSVYAEVEGGMLKLTTENGLPGDPSNTIYLEPFVIERLIAHYRELCKGPSKK